MLGVYRAKILTIVFTLSIAGLALRSYIKADEQKITTVADCSFVTQPDRFLAQEGRVRKAVADRVTKFSRAMVRSESAAPVAATEMPQRNFIDTEIFGKLATLNVASAPLSTDGEFLRRVTLDLTGRIPSP